MSKVKVMSFLHQVKQEISKVVWPDRKEVFLTTTIVVVLSVIAGAFFTVVDGIIFRAIEFLLGI